MSWDFYKNSDIQNKENIDIYNMCKDTYTKAEVKFYYDKENFYRKNNDFLCYIDRNNHLRATLVLAKYTYAFKVLLLCHDGTSYGKQLLFDKLANLISTKGFIVELSGKPNYIIQSRYNLKPIVDKSMIYQLLDSNKKGFEIIMNDDYKPLLLEKGSYVYSKKVKIKDNIIYDKQNLYGIGCGDDFKTFMKKSSLKEYICTYTDEV